MEESQTIEQSLSSRRPTVAMLYRDHSQPLLLWLASKVSRNSLEDTHQAVWSRVVEHYATKFDGDNFRAWLFQIARNYLVDESRRQKRVPQPDEDMLLRADKRAREPYDILVDRERRNRLAGCIEQLGEPRKAIVKAKAAGMDYDEFISALKLSKQQAFQHFFAAKKRLKACMESKKVEAV